METLYLVSAVLGVTILLGQIALLLFGIGGHGDWSHDAEPATDLDASHADYQFGPDSAHDVGPSSPAGGADHSNANSASHFFSVLSFRTAVAAVAFFGLTGMAATTAALPPPEPFMLAVAAGIAAMYGVYYLMRALYRLNCDGAQRIERAVGREGVVYLSIPGAHEGRGKIHFTLQNRLIEIDAVTAGERLPTGANVVITNVLGPESVEVSAIPESSRTVHV